MIDRNEVFFADARLWPAAHSSSAHPAALGRGAWRMHACTHAHMHVCLHAHACTHTHTCTCTHACTCAPGPLLWRRPALPPAPGSQAPAVAPGRCS
eukprot:366476-Chlamydomonas_euryale.AAC.6